MIERHLVIKWTDSFGRVSIIITCVDRQQNSLICEANVEEKNRQIYDYT